MKITPVISVRIIPQTTMQYIMWARYINVMRSIQSTEGTGILVDINYPGFDILMPQVKQPQEVRKP